MIPYPLIVSIALLLATGNPSQEFSGPQDQEAGVEAVPTLHAHLFAAMGTEVNLEVIHANEQVAKKAIKAAEKEFARIEDLMTTWRDSPLTRLNAEAGSGAIVVPEELAMLIGRSLAVSELTGGAFDPTYASAGKLWDFKAEPPVLPSPHTLKAALEKVGYQKVTLDIEAFSVTLPEGTQLGLGGIAKGYGVDRAMKVLMDNGIEHAVVNAGGDLKALGNKFGKPWRMAIKHPRDKEKPLAVIPLANVCLVTSGDYERFFEVDGKRYHHILDPRTGYPATGAMSASILAPDAAFADALATAMVVLGPEKGLAIVESIDRVEALIVDMSGKVHRSSGLPSKGESKDKPQAPPTKDS